MSGPRYPTTLADIQYHLKPIQFQDQDASRQRATSDAGPISYNNPSLYATLKSLRKRNNISILNRLTSILKDAHYVRSIALKYPSLPVIPNRRNGNWYVSPYLPRFACGGSPPLSPSSSTPIRCTKSSATTSTTPALHLSSLTASRYDRSTSSVYFKSTDGHFDQWAFSLRRLNLHLLDILGEHGGAIIVDATASGGKYMPDALRWTVPIWTVVINGILFPEWDERREHGSGVPGWYGSAAENGDESVERTLSKINRRLEGWKKDFENLGLNVDDLRRKVRRPIRIVWEVNGLDQTHPNSNDITDSTTLRRDPDVNVLVLCSASRSSRQEDAETGYIQGAADDAETWAKGLTPESFWRHHESLLACPEDEMSNLIYKLVVDTNTFSRVPGSRPVLIQPTKLIYIAEESYIPAELVAPIRGTASQLQIAAQKLDDFSLIISCHRTIDPGTRPVCRNLSCRTGKLGSRDLRDKLPDVLDSVGRQFTANKKFRILIVCESGQDLSVGVTVAILCRFFADDGQLQVDSGLEALASHDCPFQIVDKMVIRRRLAWISGVKPDVNPSRSTLQAVNSVLMDPPS